MFRRRKRQPWWTYPIVAIAMVYGVIQAERHTKFIWGRIAKPTLLRKLNDLLDEKIPKRSRKNRQ